MEGLEGLLGKSREDYTEANKEGEMKKQKADLVGLINLEGKYRFVSNDEQLIRLSQDALDHRLKDEVVIIDSDLVRDGRAINSRLIERILLSWRTWRLTIMMISNEDNQPNRFIQESITHKVGFKALPIPR